MGKSHHLYLIVGLICLLVSGVLFFKRHWIPVAIRLDLDKPLQHFQIIKRPVLLPDSDPEIRP